MRSVLIFVALALSGCAMRHLQPPQNPEARWQRPSDAHDNASEGHWVCPPGTWFAPGTKYSETHNFLATVQCTQWPQTQPQSTHAGAPQRECNVQGDCWISQPILDDDTGRPVLTPLGCFMAKTRITWIFGERVQDCPRKD